MNRASRLNMSRGEGRKKEGRAGSKAKEKRKHRWYLKDRGRKCKRKKGKKEGRKEEGGSRNKLYCDRIRQPSKETCRNVANTTQCLRWARRSTQPPPQFVALLFAFSFLWREPLSVESQPASIPPLSLTPHRLSLPHTGK